jgi:hypothetical protein
MLFLFETKKKGIISVDANIVEGQLQLYSANVTDLGKREVKDLESVARTLLAAEGKFEAGIRDLRDYK